MEHRHDDNNSSFTIEQETTIRHDNDCNKNKSSSVRNNIHKKQQEQRERITKEVQRLRELSMSKLKSTNDSISSSSNGVETEKKTTSTTINTTIKPIIIPNNKPVTDVRTNYTVPNHSNVTTTVTAPNDNNDNTTTVQKCKTTSDDLIVDNTSCDVQEQHNKEQESTQQQLELFERKVISEENNRNDNTTQKMSLTTSEVQQQDKINKLCVQHNNKKQQSAQQLELVLEERKPTINIRQKQNNQNDDCHDNNNKLLTIKSDKLQKETTTTKTTSLKKESNNNNNSMEQHNNNCNVDDVARRYPQQIMKNSNSSYAMKEESSFISSNQAEVGSNNKKQMCMSGKQHNIITTTSNCQQQLNSNNKNSLFSGSNNNNNNNNNNDQYHEQSHCHIKNMQQDEQEVNIKLEEVGMMMIHHENEDNEKNLLSDKMNNYKEWDNNDIDNDYDDDMDSTYRPTNDHDDDETVVGQQEHNNNNRKRKIDIKIDSRQQKKISLNKQKNALKEYNNNKKHSNQNHQQLDDDDSAEEEIDDDNNTSSSASTTDDDNEKTETEIEMGKVVTTIDIASTEQLPGVDSSSTTQKEDVFDFSIIGLLNTITFDPHNNHPIIVEITPPSPPFNLLIDLFAFQKQALGFMYEIETKNHGNVPNANIVPAATATTTAAAAAAACSSSLSLQAIAPPDVTQSNTIVVQQSLNVHPPQNQRDHELNIRAGWLSNEPGMGKTVVAIALICSNRLSIPPDQERTSTWKTVCDRFNEFLQRPSRYGTAQEWKTKKQRIMLKATVIITSNSLLGQWEDEFAKYANSLQVERYHPPSEKAHTLDLSLLLRDADKECSKRLSRADVIMTTATVKWPDIILKNFNFHRVIMDEAHLLGKSGAAIFNNAKPFKAKYRWCITSSPMSTSLLDLEKQAEFLGFMKVQKFVQSFRSCKGAFEAKRLSDYLGWDTKLRNEQFHSFANLLKQVMLRQKAITLPQFSSMSIVTVKMNHNERLHYRTQFQDTEIQKQLKKYSTQSLGCPVAKLQTLLVKCAYAGKKEFRKQKVKKLLQYLEQDLNEHRRVNGDDNDDSSDNEEEEDNDSSHETRYGMKVVIFTISDATHADCFSCIKALDKSIRVYHLDGIAGGGADRRDEVIRRFQLLSTRRPAVLICTWKKKISSGVLGISLTKASKIYFMEPWIDPTMEEEATRRIRRIGQQQQKNVSIVKFVYDQTFEQNIILLHRMMKSISTSGVEDDDDDDDKVRIWNGVLSVEAIQVVTKGMLLDQNTIYIPNQSNNDGGLRLSHRASTLNESRHERLAVKQEEDDAT